MLPKTDPVGLPALAAMALGFFVFLVTLFLARMRARGQAGDSGGKRDNSSILWIILQGVGMGLAAFGPIDASLDPLSPSALVTAAVVLALMLGAAMLFDWSSRTMGRNWALVARTRGDAELVTNGPFALVRNPIYVALAMFMLAMAIAY
uniref:methyltransferase family protein n=2 Tax=unclassified Sphingomonas TaxID=196159 RepID=UPI0035A8B02D